MTCQAFNFTNKEMGYINLGKKRYNKKKLVLSIMRQVAEIENINLQAFKIIVTDPDSILNSFLKKVKEVGPDGQKVTKVVLVVSAEVKKALVKNIRRQMGNLVNNIRRRMIPQTLKIRADIEMICFQFDGVLHIKEQGILVLKNAIMACKEAIERHKGELLVKEAPKAVGAKSFRV